jgi:hypothetical protein
MANPFTYPDYDFRWTARWQPAWPTILGRLNEIMERVDWCRWEIRNSTVTGAVGGVPTGYYDDPFLVGGTYLWHDTVNDVIRVSKSAPTSADDPDSVEIGMGGTA